MESNVIFPELPTYVGALSLAGLLSLLVTVGLPVLAALFMRSNWSAGRKGLVLLAFAAVKGFVEAALVASDAGTAFDVGAAAYTALVQFILAVVFHFGLLRNTRLQRAAMAGGVLKSRTIDGRVV